jgi:hypothetical protein
MVICDAGGGTVVSYDHICARQVLIQPKDLISYVVESTDPFMVKECVRGDGKFWFGVC